MQAVPFLLLQTQQEQAGLLQLSPHGLRWLCLQVMTPAMTLSVCYFAGLERLTSPLVVSVAAISLGTGACVLSFTACCSLPCIKPLARAL